MVSLWLKANSKRTDNSRSHPARVREQTHATPPGSELQQRLQRAHPPPPNPPAFALPWPRHGPRPPTASVYRDGGPVRPPRGAGHALAVGDAVDEELPPRRATDRVRLAPHLHVCGLFLSLGPVRFEDGEFTRISHVCCDAVRDAPRRIPAEHGVQTAEFPCESHLGTLAALRLVDRARRAEELAEATRVLICWWHWAPLSAQGQAKMARVATR